MIRSLEMLVADGGDSEGFANRYAGDLEPVRTPHRARWSRAERHWSWYNSRAMRKDIVAADMSRAEAVRQAERFSIRVLGPLAVLGHCPRWACTGPARVSRERLQQIVREAREEL